MNKRTNPHSSALSFRSHYDGSFVPVKALGAPVATRTKAMAAPAAAHVPVARGAARHWLLDSESGRALLKLKLRMEVPGVKTSLFDRDYHLDGEMNRMIDLLGLRNWAAPKGVMGKVGAFFTLLKFEIELHMGQPFPSLNPFRD